MNGVGTMVKFDDQLIIQLIHFTTYIYFLYKDTKDVYRLNSPREQVISNDPLKGLTLCQWHTPDLTERIHRNHKHNICNEITIPVVGYAIRERGGVTVL